MNYFICPKCKHDLTRKNNSLVCSNNHCYDISSNGYVNLLIHKSSMQPGDNKEMVKARNVTMQNGYYDRLLLAVSEIISAFNPSVVLDLACGEGSLTSKLASDKFDSIGIDISKSAIHTASSKDKRTNYAVASITDIPIKSNSVDLILNCFAPLDSKEALRVLKDNGIVIKVTPYEKHLFELKKEIYPEVYLNKQKESPKEFVEINQTIVRDKVLLKGEYLDAVIKMTPYFYRTPKYLLESVKDKEIECTLEFCITILKKDLCH